MSTPDPVPEIVTRFGREYFTVNSITERRQQQMTSLLSRFAVWIDKPIEQATDADVREFIIDLMQSEMKASTVAFYLKILKPFFRWAWRERVIDADAWMRLREVSPPRGHNTSKPRPYSRKELGVFWSSLDTRWPLTTELRIQRWRNGTSPWRSIKKHAMRLQLDAMVELALVCGLRRGEIYHLSIDDCHWDNKYIVVHGKRVDQNDKIRDVPYPDSTRDAVWRWFRMRGMMSPQPNTLLWLSITGPDPTLRLTERRMGHILHTFGPWEFHRLRHTCATERLRNGMELQDLQKFLGHARIQQTLAYAEIVRDDVHRAAARTDAAFQAAIRPAA